ncbi:MAG: succinate dehydrogenase/fumarate reductase iron-sulfur subunit [Gammaproteobacteria bacterium]|nr:succinate dehydrogenase/fumarate reductase iron-sulfur subunit [Gammaproteobacteria bacterium]MDH3378546.1 succinate dehydrogenase/fumarate reductase iron-sulfur subunit [Gammaproteobacteria bacterium]
MSEQTIDLEILRYDPEQDQAPHFQTYTVPYREDWVVLDAINYVKDELDRTLSYRWSCHMAVCGSCGMVVNGEPALACDTFLRDCSDRIRVEPLQNFPIERDLVVVMDDFIDKLCSVKPYIVPQHEKSVDDGQYLQTPAELARFNQYTACINCLLCYSACPQYALNDAFVGPAALALAHRYNLDSRDVGRGAREDVVASNPGIWECSFVGACSEVCPKSVDPAAAIQQTKIASTSDYFMNFLMPGKRR